MNRTILLVDDLQMFLEIERDFFKDTMAQIITAKDGIEALEILKTNKPAVVFMDLQMPRMDGVTCCQKIKGDPQLRDTPVALITSGASETDRARCHEAGCNYFLTKPASRDTFLNIARTYIPDINRREKRLRYTCDCTVHISDVVLNGTLYDLSSHGAFIATDHLIDDRGIVRVSFTLPTGAKVDCRARVVWVNQSSGKYPKGFGLRFSLLEKDAKAALASFMGH